MIRKTLMTHLPHRLPLIAALCLLACFNATAQIVHFKVGMGIADRYSGARPIPGMMLGAAYEHEFSAHWSVSPGLFIQSKGWKEKSQPVVYDHFTKEQCPDDWDEANSCFRTGKMGEKWSNTLLTLAAPFNYYIRTGQGRYVLLAAGPYASYGITGRRTISGDPYKQEGERISYTTKGFNSPDELRFSSLRRWDAGVQVQIGMEFLTGITVGLQGDFGVLNQAVTGAARRNVSGMLMLSYNFHRANTYREQVIDDFWKSVE